MGLASPKLLLFEVIAKIDIIKRPLNPPQGDLGTALRGLFESGSPPAGRRIEVPVGVDLGGEIRILQLPTFLNFFHLPNIFP